MAKFQVFCWYDKVDKTYLPDSVLLNQFHRPVCRGFLTQFERDRKMRQDEYDLVKVGDFDTDTGILTGLSVPEVIDPTQVLQSREPVSDSVNVE